MNNFLQGLRSARVLGVSTIVLSLVLAGCGGSSSPSKTSSSSVSSSVSSPTSSASSLSSSTPSSASSVSSSPVPPSSSSSSSGTAVNTTQVSGFVVDPAIEGASVRLDDAQGDALAMIQMTDATGAFMFTRVPANQLTGAFITAKGGKDAATGVDFTGLALVAPFVAGSTVVSPLSTLVAYFMEEGLSLEAAKVKVTAIFGTKVGDPLADPRNNGAAQKVNVQLSMLASALRSEDGFEKVAELVADFGANWQAMQFDLQADTDFSSTVLADINNAFAQIVEIEKISSSLTATDVIRQLNLVNLKQGISQFLGTTLAYFPQDPAIFETNITAFARALLEANNWQGMALSSNTYANVLRYAFNTYAMDVSSFDVDGWVVPAGLSTDTQIPVLAKMTVIDHTLALSAGEELTTSEAKRAYYYASDLAPAYRSQQLFTGVLDDNYSDEVYGFIAASYIKRGMKEQADTILKTQIFSPYWIAYGYYHAGKAFESINDMSNAKKYWDTASDILIDYTDDKGVESLTSDEAALFQSLSGRYVAHGFGEASDEVLAPVNAFLAMQDGYTTAFGRILVAFGSRTADIVDEAVAQGLTPVAKADALEAVRFFAAIVNKTGLQSATASCGDHYMLRTSYFTSLASFYVTLQEPEQVRAQITAFNNLRASHSCTAAKTNTYIKNLVGAFAYLNDLAGYENLVATGMTAEATAAQIKAANDVLVQYKAIALARTGDHAGAIALVETQPTIAQTITALTNSGISVSSVNAGLAISLFDEGLVAAGAAVLDAAWAYAASSEYAQESTSNPANFVRYGCAKIAKHTFVYADQAQGLSRLQSCRNLVDGYAQQQAAQLPASIADAYTYLSEVAMQLGNTATAKYAFDKALTTIESLTGADKAAAIEKAVLYGVSEGVLHAGVDYARVLNLVESLHDQYLALVSAAVDQKTLRTAMDYANTIMSRYAYLIEGLRKQAIVHGAQAELADHIKHIQTSALALIRENEAIVDQITTASQRTSYYGYLIGTTGGTSYFARAKLFDHAEDILALINNTESVSTNNAYRLAIAKHWLEHNDFVGSTVASVDVDNDGLPDFFEAKASEADIIASGLVMDNDSDNDGITDAQDSTPFYCVACAL